MSSFLDWLGGWVGKWARVPQVSAKDHSKDCLLLAPTLRAGLEHLCHHQIYFVYIILV